MKELADNMLELANCMTNDLPPAKRGRRPEPVRQMYVVINKLRETAHELLVLDGITTQ